MSFVEVLPPELTGPDHPEWFAERAKGITASEIAAVIGVSPYESPYSLYWRKRGVLAEQADTDAMRWGRRLEQHVRDEFRERHQDELIVLGAGLYCHVERPWQMASPDALVYDVAAANDWIGDVDAIAGVEVKTTGSWDGWGPDGSDEVPLHIRCQVIWQADVLGVPCVYVPVVNGRTYREYVVQADPQDAALMRSKAEAFLDDIRYETPPDVDGSDATLGALKQIHPDLDDAETQVPGKLAAQWLAACKREKAAHDRRKTFEAQLRDRMGRAKYAVHDGQKVATRSVYEVKEHVRSASKVDKLVPAKERT